MKDNWLGLLTPNAATSIRDHRIQLSESERQMQQAGLDTFAANPQVLRIWEFSPESGPLQIPLPGNRHYNIPNSNLNLIWPFLDGRMLLHSAKILEAGIAMVGIRCGVLFDSNLYGDIVQFVESPELMNSADRLAIGRLLEFIIASKYDYQALPYLIEQYAKNPLIVAREYAFKITKAILKLHTMDEEYFRATHVIRPDHEVLLEHYEEGIPNYD